MSTTQESGPAETGLKSAHNETLIRLLLAWFDQFGRVLPWRCDKDPYRIWVSEIMLQQTQVQTAIPYYERFMAAFPTVCDLAAAAEETVLKSWEGLGYYTRARHLLAAARIVVKCHGGILPDDEAALRHLPGIGAYTAGAILSIAWQQKIPAVDGNVVRVFARLTGIAWRTGDPADRGRVRDLVLGLLPPERPGDFNEAMMDLGATICLPRDPLCPDCPLAGLCVARQENKTAVLPLRNSKKTVTAQQRTVLILRCRNRWHVNRRPDGGLLAGLYTFDWLDGALDSGLLERLNTRLAALPGCTWTRLPSRTHLFTHRTWHLDALQLDLADPDLSVLSGFEPPDEDRPVQEERWVSARELATLPFPAAVAPYRDITLSGHCSDETADETDEISDGPAEDITDQPALPVSP